MGLKTVSAAVLSVLLLILAIGIPFYYSVKILTKAETVITVVQKVDYEKIIESSPDLKTALKAYGINSAEADEFMKSDTAYEIMKEYVPEALRLLDNIPANRLSDTESVKEIINEEIDTIVDIAEENTEMKLSEEVVKEEINKTIDDNEKLIVSVAPQIKRLVTTTETVTRSGTENFLSPLVGTALIMAMVMTAVALGLCKREKIRFLLWLGIIFSVSAAVLAVVILLSEVTVIDLLSSQFDILTQVLGTALSICTSGLIIGALVWVFFACLFFVIYAVLKKRLVLQALPEAE